MWLPFWLLFKSHKGYPKETQPYFPDVANLRDWRATWRSLLAHKILTICCARRPRVGDHGSASPPFSLVLGERREDPATAACVRPGSDMDGERIASSRLGWNASMSVLGQSGCTLHRFNLVLSLLVRCHYHRGFFISLA